MGDDTTPGAAETLRDFYRAVPAADDYDAPLTPGQAQGLVEHVLDAEVVEPDQPDQPDAPERDPDDGDGA